MPVVNLHKGFLPKNLHAVLDQLDSYIDLMLSQGKAPVLRLLPKAYDSAYAAARTTQSVGLDGKKPHVDIKYRDYSIERQTPPGRP